MRKRKLWYEERGQRKLKNGKRHCCWARMIEGMEKMRGRNLVDNTLKTTFFVSSSQLPQWSLPLRKWVPRERKFQGLVAYSSALRPYRKRQETGSPLKRQGITILALWFPLQCALLFTKASLTCRGNRNWQESKVYRVPSHYTRCLLMTGQTTWARYKAQGTLANYRLGAMGRWCPGLGVRIFEYQNA